MRTMSLGKMKRRNVRRMSLGLVNGKKRKKGMLIRESNKDWEKERSKHRGKLLRFKPRIVKNLKFKENQKLVESRRQLSRKLK